jgi:hypothetical protein
MRLKTALHLLQKSSAPTLPTPAEGDLYFDTTAKSARVYNGSAWSTLGVEDYFNVMAPVYGAKGDGSTDDATAINAAITAASTAGGTVYFPPGTYIVGSVIKLLSNVRLLGAGWTASILKAKNTSNIVILEGEAYAGVGIVNSAVEQLGLDGNKANNATATHGLKVQSQNLYCDKVIVKNCRGDGFRINLTTETQQEVAGLDNSFSASRAIGCEGYGFYINAHDTVLNDCQAIQCKEAGFEMLTNAYMFYCHSWCYSSGETVTKTGYNLHGDVVCVSCVAEGASERQVNLSGANNRWIGGEVFDSTGKPNVPCFEVNAGTQTLDGVYVHGFGTGGGVKFVNEGENSRILAHFFDSEGKAAGVGTPHESVMFDVTFGGSTALGTIPGRHVRREITFQKRAASEAPNNSLFLDSTSSLLRGKDNGGTARNLVQAGREEVATANTLTISSNAFLVNLTGTTEVKKINVTYAGHMVVFSFASTPTVVNGENLKLDSNLEATAEATLTLICDGTNWHEIGRSGPTRWREVKEYVVPDTIAVPSGATNYLPPFFITFKTPQTVKLVAVYAKIQEGTSATFKLQDNEVDITGFTGIEAKPTAAKTEPTGVTMVNEHRIAPVVTAVSGTPKNLSIGIVLEHSAP